MKRNSVKAIALVIALMLGMSLVPGASFAEEEEPKQEVSAVEAEEEKEKEEPAEEKQPEEKKEQETPAADENADAGKEEEEQEEEEELQKVVSDVLKPDADLTEEEEPEAGQPVEEEEPEAEQPEEEEEPEAEQPEEEGEPEAEQPEEEEPEAEQPEEEEEPEAGQPEEEEEPEAEQPEPEEEIPDTGIYAKGSAKLYEEADKSSKVIATLADGTMLELLGVEGDWALVSTGSLEGYLYRDSVSGVSFPKKTEEAAEKEEAAEPEAEGNPEAEQPEEEIPETEIPEGEASAEEQPETAVTEAEQPEEGEEVEAIEGEGTEELPEAVEEPAAPERVVRISSSQKPVMKPGETVTLSSQLEGFEDCTEILYQWEVDKGNGFEEVAGATSPEYSFAASRETLNWAWRLNVKCK